MFIYMWNYIRGYVNIEVIGFSSERFLNLVTHKNIRVWDINRTRKGIEMKILASDLKKIRDCIRKTRCNVKISEKTGAPFFIFRNKRKKVFFIGIISFIILIYILLSFIWAIKIEGNETLNTTEIIEFCKENGLYLGSHKKSFDTKELEMKIKNNFPQISWINIHINGTLAKIRVTESLSLEKIEIDTLAPCDIIAKNDGIISTINTSIGTPKVKENDVVKKGDILVSGEVFGDNMENRTYYKQVHSMADVRAKSWYKLNFFIPYEHDEKIFTGNEKNSYQLVLFNNKISLNLFNKQPKFENYDIISSTKQMKINENFYLPFILIKNIYREIDSNKKVYSLEEAKIVGENIVTEKIVTQFDPNTDILEKKIQFVEKEDGLGIVVNLTVIENIGVNADVTPKIQINENQENEQLSS